MKNKLFTILSALLVLAILASCAPQATVSSTKNNTPRQMNASGVGEVALVPDLAYINLGVRSQAEDVGAAFSQNNEQAQRISQALTQLGVEAKDIQTSAFNIYPQQFYGPQGPMGPEDQGTTVYVVENTVYVTVRDLQNLSTLLDAVITAGANNINGISFDVSNKAEAEKEARRLAVENAKARAVELAELTGVELGEPIMINVYSSGTPIPVYEGKYLGSGLADQAPISAGQLTLRVNADIAYEIK